MVQRHGQQEAISTTRSKWVDDAEMDVQSDRRDTIRNEHILEGESGASVQPNKLQKNG